MAFTSADHDHLAREADVPLVPHADDDPDLTTMDDPPGLAPRIGQAVGGLSNDPEGSQNIGRAGR